MTELHTALSKKEFSERFLIALELRGWGFKSTRELGVLLGLSCAAISTLRNGKNLPSIPTALDLSIILKCSFEWLVTGHGTPAGFQMKSADELALVERFRTLSDKDKQKLLIVAITGVTNKNQATGNPNQKDLNLIPSK